jgi:predicted O-linked N-acetylglucosamine transferase (SPINDLY family)/2-polyprenyl-3-methyl-5-hydroxy-6-metoxy-1,4-benzoquinol methylase
MKTFDKQLNQLLDLINAGHAAQALTQIETLLKKNATHVGLLTLHAEALRVSGKTDQAVQAYCRAAEFGGGERNWLSAGVLLAAQRQIDPALRCFEKAFELAPKNPELLDAFITTLFNAGRQYEATDYARRQLEISTQPLFLINAALLLQSCDLYEESTQAFKKIHAFAPDNLNVLGAALVAARFTCDWEWIGYLQQKINACYANNDFDSPQEFPLTHLTWCSNELSNLEVTRAYLRRTLSSVTPLQPSTQITPRQRIRLGYLSCDFRNHATMHLMAGLLESHDQSRFEIYAYDHTVADTSTYRERFLNAIEHHRDIQHMTDEQAAQVIANDDLDVLIDLKLYTGGGRPGIVSYRPARLQAAYLGYPGSAASESIDYIISDRFVTPDSSAAFYSEKFCRLPHSYQCNDQQRFTPPVVVDREAHGLPQDQVVFAAFNQSYKIDPASFSIWMKILSQVDNSVLWLLGQSEAAKKHLTAQAQRFGIDPTRIIYAPFAAPQEHLTRLQLADAVLDTLICNGHTTTSDALWAGVPVITRQGHHFASRVSESLLNAIELPELVGKDDAEMIHIAQRIGLDPTYRKNLRERLAVLRKTAPLFDTQRFTRHFEKGIAMMVERMREGLEPSCIDVPAERNATSPSDLQEVFAHCPLCEGQSQAWIGVACTSHKAYRSPLPQVMQWMKCDNCGHVHTSHFWKPEGLSLLQPQHANSPLAEALEHHEAKRQAWTPLVKRAAKHLSHHKSPNWFDLGFGDASLLLTAADHGFEVSGIDTDPVAVSHLQNLGYCAALQSIEAWESCEPQHIISLTNVLQLLPQPGQVLKKVASSLAPEGLLIVSVPDMDSSSWKILDAAQANPFWSELTHLHNFTRTRLIALLTQNGFEICDIAVSIRYKAQIEIIAKRTLT